MEREKHKGFRYRVEREKIAEYKRLPAEKKLEWLEEIFLFSEAALSPQAKRVREHFRNEGKESR
jgi:hypothetical protein